MIGLIICSFARKRRLHEIRCLKRIVCKCSRCKRCWKKAFKDERKFQDNFKGVEYLCNEFYEYRWSPVDYRKNLKKLLINNQCDFCGNVEGLKKCDRCKSVYYCSRKCQ